MMTAPAADSHLLLRALVDELVRSGMTHAVTCPGSRNTPIVEALAGHPQLACTSVIDERSAGFFAVGAAKASGRPVAVTCTSGTAVANLLPAVVEAHHARVPLIVLSADRPPELREVGAGQTIDQLRIFGSATRWFFDVGLHEATPERMRWIRTLGCRAYAVAAGPEAGPVQLDIPLREPLVAGALPEEPGGGGRPGGVPWTSTDRPATAALPPLPRSSRTVIVAGELGTGPRGAAAGAELARHAARAGIPVLADPLSGARTGAAAIAHYDLILREPDPELTPELVLRFGELPTSKPLRAWLAGLGARQIAFCEEGAWPDPSAVLERRVVGLQADLISRLADVLSAAPPDWLERWRRADAAVAAALAGALDGELTEPSLAATLVATLPTDATLFVASSMPIRDIEEFAPVRDAPPRVLANRGANGIDGTVSAAFGAAAVSSGPVVLLIGDVALAHDIGGLLAARRTDLSLTIVLVDNDGGGIFSFLPIADVEPVFTRHVATPHGVPFDAAGALFGCAYRAATTLEELRSMVHEGITADGVTLIHVRTDRVENRRLHADLAQRASHSGQGSSGR